MISIEAKIKKEFKKKAMFEEPHWILAKNECLNCGKIFHDSFKCYMPIKGTLYTLCKKCRMEIIGGSLHAKKR